MSGLAEQLARAFGKPEVMAGLYLPEVEWHLPLSMRHPPIHGREAVEAFNRFIDTRYDASTVEVSILDALLDGDLSAVRFRYSAQRLPGGQPYTGYYSLFVREIGGRIRYIHESLDTLAVIRVWGEFSKEDSDAVLLL